MRSIRRTTRFKKDAKRLKKRGKDFGKLSEVIVLLLQDTPLPSRYRDHELTGNLKGIRDLHLEPDWLLLYELTDEELVLVRTGSHSDLF